MNKKGAISEHNLSSDSIDCVVGSAAVCDCSHMTDSSYSRRDELAEAKMLLGSFCPAGAEVHNKRGGELWTGSVCTCQHNRLQVEVLGIADHIVAAFSGELRRPVRR